MDGQIKRYNIWRHPRTRWSNTGGIKLGNLYTFEYHQFEEYMIDLLQNDYMHVYRSGYRTNPGWPKIWY
jgi:hypothetical protein